METVIKCSILSLMMAMGCRAFLDTLLPRRSFRCPWPAHTIIPVLLAGFLIIGLTPIPPYIFQPVRLIFILFLTVKLYYQAGILKSFIVSVLLCEIYWIVSLLAASVPLFLPLPWNRYAVGCEEVVTDFIYLGLMLLFHFKCKGRFLNLSDEHWTRFSLFPLFGLIFMVSIAMTSWDKNPADSRAKLAAILSFLVINGCILYFILAFINKEKEIQQLRLLHERTLSQMNQYRSIQKSSKQQRKYLHDYKNQLNCIQGMLKDGKNAEAIAYISGLTGSIRKSTEYVNTGHTAVNVVLNQKYQEACEEGITMSITANDLTLLSIPEEQIVSLLGNLLDNAIEACKRLNPDLSRVIDLKMVLEDDQLILSTRNPVSAPLEIKNNRIQTQKSDAVHHGIGLLTIDSIIRENLGTSVLKCEDGWFRFSAIIPTAPHS